MSIADTVASMLAAGGKFGGVLCSTADEHKFTVHGIPVRASNYVPLGFAFLISEEAWVMVTMRLYHPPYRPIAWMDLE
jgi:hypothetical protein